MPKKILIALLCAILVAILAPFGTTQIEAQENPDFCPPIANEAGPFTITLTDGSPSPAPKGEGWIWEYQITAYPKWKIKNIRKVLLTYPDCCGEDIEILQPAYPNITPPCGSALPIRMWPMVCDDFTLKLPFTTQNKEDGKISIKTKNNNEGINTIGLLTTLRFYVAAIKGPACAPNVALENEPVSGQTLFKGEEFDWLLLYDGSENSFDVKCPNDDCKIETLQLDKIPFNAESNSGFFDSLPYDEPFVGSASPGCTYVRTRSGGVKKICPK